MQAVRDAAHDDTRSPVVQQVAKGAVVVGEAAAAVAHAAAEQVCRLDSFTGVLRLDYFHCFHTRYARAAWSAPPTASAATSSVWGSGLVVRR